MPGSTEMLRAAGLRATAQRAAVLDVLHHAATHGEHLTVQDIGAQVRDRLGAVSTQAVYDCLDALTAGGLAERVDLPGHAALYEAARTEPHDHLVCRRCGTVRDVPRSDGPCRALPRDAGQVVAVEATFQGLCPACASARP